MPRSISTLGSTDALGPGRGSHSGADFQIAESALLYQSAETARLYNWPVRAITSAKTARRHSASLVPDGKARA
ncbi:MAG: hypothetical protein QOK03_2282 [Candidatus Binataceae bacterium]|nr:hypothetical protein [Candidatus Binataceae bacterium]